ncbi:MAG: response regulator [Phaeodactylibacter sp.]|nr:response regulator [Phaeodactylibacter sp.]MCB9052249.1 response regulator [Lewinellaceae bacterium]
MTKEQAIIRTVIVEDEKDSRDILQWLLQKCAPDVEVAAVCSSGLEALEQIPRLEPELVFLDIKMPFMDGFQLLEALPELDFNLVFTTAFDEFAIRAFEASALHYLLKPIQEEGLKEALKRVRKQRLQPGKSEQEQYKLLLAQAGGLRTGKLEKIAFPAFDSMSVVNIRDVIYCQADSNYSDVYMREGDKLCVSRTLKALEDTLEPLGFMRVHHSYLVNLAEISSFHRKEGGSLIMSNGHEVKVSRSRKDDLLNYLGSLSI